MALAKSLAANRTLKQVHPVWSALARVTFSAQLYLENNPIDIVGASALREVSNDVLSKVCSQRYAVASLAGSRDFIASFWRSSRSM